MEIRYFLNMTGKILFSLHCVYNNILKNNLSLT